MRNLLYTLLLGVLLITQSCHKSLVELESTKSVVDQDIHSVDGILAFENTKTFARFCQEKANISESDRKALEEKYNFISIQSTYYNTQIQLTNTLPQIQYSGAPGVYLNKDRMVIIENNLYIFEQHKLKYIPLKDVSLATAKVMLTDANQENNAIIHVNPIEETTTNLDKEESNSGARASSDYVVSTNVYEYGGTGNRVYGTASLRGTLGILADNSRFVNVQLIMKTYFGNYKGYLPSACNDNIYQASGNFNVYVAARYGGANSGGVYGPYPFTVNIPSTYGSSVANFNVATIVVNPDSEGSRGMTYFEGYGTFSTSHGTCNYSNQVTTTGNMNL